MFNAFKKQEKRKGFTLIELLLVISIIAILAGIIASSIDISSVFISARDAERKHNQGQIENAVYQHLVDKWDIPNKAQISEDPDNPTDICRYGLTDPSCVNLDALVNNDFLAELPTDPASVSPLNGYTIWLSAGRPRIGAALLGQAATVSVSLLSSNLIAHWRLDDNSGGDGSTTVDSTSNANHGTLRSMESGDWTTTTAPIGLSNPYALQFNEGNDYVEIPHNNTYLLDNGTVTLWFRSPDVSADQGIFTKDSNLFDTGGHISIATASPGGSPYGSHCQPFATTGIHARIQSTSSYYCLSSGNLADDTWHHVTVTFGAGEFNLYINGAFADFDGYTGGLGTTSGGAGNYEPIAIGSHSGGSDDLIVTPLEDFFTGIIDDVRIYDRALSVTEIQQIANGQG